MVPSHRSLPSISRYSDLPLRVIVDSPFYEQISQTYGMLVYAVSTGRWLMIQRRHSMEILLLLKGNYARELVPSLVARLTSEEQEILRSALTSRESYIAAIHSIYQTSGRRINEGAWLRMQEATPIILRSLERYAGQGQQLAWLWPKGYRRLGTRTLGTQVGTSTAEHSETGLRAARHERTHSPSTTRERGPGTGEVRACIPGTTPGRVTGVERATSLPKCYDNHGRKGPEESRDAAMREFCEESGLVGITCPYTVSYDWFDYAHKTALGRVFMTRCWVCVVRDELPLPEVRTDEVEVADRKWFTTEEVEASLREVELGAFQDGKRLVDSILTVLGGQARFYPQE